MTLAGMPQRTVIRNVAVALAMLTVGTLAGCNDGDRGTHSRLPGVGQPGRTDTVEPRVDSAAARLEGILLEATPPPYMPAFAWDVVRRHYDARRYAPRWIGPDGLTEGGRALVDVLCALETEGLGSPVLAALPEQPDSAGEFAESAAVLGELDLRLTAALLTAAAALRSGQVRPDSLAAAWHVAAPRAISDTAAAALLADSTPARALMGFQGEWPGYRLLLKAADRLRAAAEAEDTNATLPVNLRPGQRDSAVVALRQRLILTGDLDSTLGSGVRYDAPLVSAVRSFQRRHGLTPRGRLDSTTRAQLAVPISRRLALVAANLERYRWLPNPTGGAAMLQVNVATGRLEGYVGGQLALAGEVQAGRCPAGPPPVLVDTVHGVRADPPGVVLELGGERRVRLVPRNTVARDSSEPCIVVPKPAAVAEFVRLAGPDPVLLYLLWPTAWVDKRDGWLRFRRDTTDQDEALVRALAPTHPSTLACRR